MCCRNVLLISFVCLLTQPGWGQASLWTLPAIQTHRRADMAYMDSLSVLAKRQYRFFTDLPLTARHDTLRFKALYFLGQLYKTWYGRNDSTLYFGQELILQARQRRNLFYEVNGKVIVADYYRGGEINTPQALRLNLDVLSQLPPANEYYDVTRYRVYINLSTLYSLAREYDRAIQYLMMAQSLLVKDLKYAAAASSHSFRCEIQQHLGYVYNQQGRFAESEAHYLAAEQLAATVSSLASRGYIYDDLAELYLKFGQFAKALPYALKAETIWNQLKVSGESKGWGTLACVYAGLGQDEQAYRYAQSVLQLPKPSNFVLEQAYSTLYRVFERRNDWKNSADYYRKYVAIRDTIAINQRTVELAAIQKQAEFDRINIIHQQAQQLQVQRMLTVQKQGEINQLQADTLARSLTEKARLSEQQRQFDNERSKATLQRQKIAQQMQQQHFDRQVLQHENQSQRNQLVYLASSFAFVVGILLLLLSLSQLRKRKAEAELLLTRERKETNARIIQTQEAEQQRIAADLHDDLGGTLATLHLRLADLAEQQTDSRVRTQLAALEPIIRQGSHDLRRIAHNLMPPAFAQMGLRAALEQLVRSQPPHPTRFTFITAGTPRPLPLEVELNAYRIVSELVQNIHKHAHATRADIQLLYHDTYLSLIVEDNGVGDQSLKLANDLVGIGLKTSSLRAEYIGAALRRDVSGSGTLVVLDVPYLSMSTTDDHATPRPPAAGR